MSKLGKHSEGARLRTVGARLRTERYAGGFENTRGFAYVEKQRQAARQDIIAWCVARGYPVFSTNSRACVCGAPALRVWRNEGWCKTCYAAEKPRVGR